MLLLKEIGEISSEEDIRSIQQEVLDSDDRFSNIILTYFKKLADRESDRPVSNEYSSSDYPSDNSSNGDITESKSFLGWYNR